MDHPPAGLEIVAAKNGLDDRDYPWPADVAEHWRARHVRHPQTLEYSDSGVGLVAEQWQIRDQRPTRQDPLLPVRTGRRPGVHRASVSFSA